MRKKLVAIVSVLAVVLMLAAPPRALAAGSYALFDITTASASAQSTGSASQGAIGVQGWATGTIDPGMALNMYWRIDSTCIWSPLFSMNAADLAVAAGNLGSVNSGYNFPMYGSELLVLVTGNASGAKVRVNVAKWQTNGWQ